MANIDPTEIAKFAKLASHWWNPLGELKTLHDINPLRLQYINDRAPLKDKKVLDIGCGGGILAEGLDRCGARVTGIDLGAEAIQAAQYHQKESHTSVDYLLI